MSDTPVLVYAQIGLLGLMLSALPLSWWWLRQRDADVRVRLAALTALTLFLTFDLIVFGSFTRLTDSGLGCPDWPGCYGAVSPVGAHAEIKAAEAAMPTGPVTAQKAWIEMVHRYLAMTVGALIVVATLAGWAFRRRLPLSPWWPTATLAWVIVQGLFGMLTVTWRLKPAIVTLHLLGGMFLLALLVMQHEALRGRSLRWPRALRRLLLAVFADLGDPAGARGGTAWYQKGGLIELEQVGRAAVAWQKGQPLSRPKVSDARAQLAAMGRSFAETARDVGLYDRVEAGRAVTAEAVLLRAILRMVDADPPAINELAELLRQSQHARMTL